MGKGKNDMEVFLESISDEKLIGFMTGEYLIQTIYSLGYHLDHQTVNNTNGKHRLYLQPLDCGRTKKSKGKSSNVDGHVKVSDPGDP